MILLITQIIIYLTLRNQFDAHTTAMFITLMVFQALSIVFNILNAIDP
jgi:hypothetical protein